MADDEHQKRTNVGKDDPDDEVLVPAVGGLWHAFKETLVTPWKKIRLKRSVQPVIFITEDGSPYVPDQTYGDLTPATPPGLVPVRGPLGQWHTYDAGRQTAGTTTVADRAGTNMAAAPTGVSWQIGRWSITFGAINASLTAGLLMTNALQGGTSARVVGSCTAAGDAAPAAMAETGASGKLSGWSGRTLTGTEVLVMVVTTNRGTLAAGQFNAYAEARQVA